VQSNVGPLSSLAIRVEFHVAEKRPLLLCDTSIDRLRLTPYCRPKGHQVWMSHTFGKRRGALLARAG